jgi:hypothetical protein
MVVGRPTFLGLPRAAAGAFLLMFAAAFVGYGALWRHAPVQDGDSPQYLEVARDLADFSLDALHNRTPGYPVLLALTGSRDRPTHALFFVSLLLHVSSVWLLGAVLYAVGIETGWLILLCSLLLLPPYVEPAAYVMTENLAQFTLVTGLACLVLWFAHRTPWLLLVSALAIGYSGITRPAYEALALAVSVVLLIMPRASRGDRTSHADVAKAAVALVAGSLVIVGTVSFVNYRKFNYAGVSPLLGFHLSTKTMTFVERLPDEYAAVREVLVRARDAELTKRGGTHSGTQAVWAAQSELSRVTGLTTPQLSAYLVRMNVALIRAAPLDYLQEVARSVATYWLPAAGPLASMQSTALRWLWALLHIAVMTVFWLEIVALAGVVLLGIGARSAGAGTTLVEVNATAHQARAYLLAAVIVFYTMVLSCAIDIGEPRQRRSTDVLIVFMCFVGAHIWRQTIASAAASVIPGTSAAIATDRTPAPPGSTR